MTTGNARKPSPNTAHRPLGRRRDVPGRPDVYYDTIADDFFDRRTHYSMGQAFKRAHRNIFSKKK